MAGCANKWGIRFTSPIRCDQKCKTILPAIAIITFNLWMHLTQLAGITANHQRADHVTFSQYVDHVTFRQDRWGTLKQCVVWTVKSGTPNEMLCEIALQKVKSEEHSHII